MFCVLGEAKGINIFMREILLDNVSYSKINNLILSAVAYSFEDNKIEKLGFWRRKDIINAIKSEKISRAKVDLNIEGNYISDCICHVIGKEIDGEMYLINSDYFDRTLEREDMIEMNEAHKR